MHFLGRHRRAGRTPNRREDRGRVSAQWLRRSAHDTVSPRVFRLHALGVAGPRCSAGKDREACRESLCENARVQADPFTDPFTQVGHVLYPAFITFSVDNVSPSEVRFSVNISAKFASVWDKFAFQHLGGADFEANIWNQLMDGVQALCK